MLRAGLLRERLVLFVLSDKLLWEFHYRVFYACPRQVFNSSLRRGWRRIVKPSYSAAIVSLVLKAKWYRIVALTRLLHALLPIRVLPHHAVPLGIRRCNQS